MVVVFRVNVHEAKTRLSHYLDKVESGETMILCRYNQPVAEVRPVKTKAKRRKRVFGVDDGFGVSPEFFKPLPDDLLRLFHGEDEA